MGRFRIWFATLAMVLATSVLGLAGPGCAAACSCVEPQPIATYRGEPNTLVLSGTVVAMTGPTQGTFRVERWFQGSSDVAEIAIQGGDGASCGIPIAVGQQLVMVAFLNDGVLQPNSCSPNGDLTNDQGKALLDEVVAAFGPGTPPGGAAPTSGGGGPAIPEVVLVIGGVAVLLVFVVAAASLVSGRRA